MAQKVKRILVADVPADLHNKVKAEAAYLNVTMRQFILTAIFEKMKRDEEYRRKC